MLLYFHVFLLVGGGHVARGCVMYELDQFEKHYIKGEGEVLFRDKIGIPKYFLPMMLLGMLAFGAMIISMVGPLLGGLMALAGLLFVTLGNLMLSGYRLIVSDAGLQAFVGITSRKIPFDRIESMEIVEASLGTYPLGKNIVRRGKGGVGYMPGLGPFRGVRLHIKNQKSHVFFASTRPEELKRAIKTGMARAQGQREEAAGVVLDLDTGDEVALEQPVESVVSSSRGGESV